MSLTIELPSETVQALTVIAKGKGKSPEDYAREVLENEILTSKRVEELRFDVQTGMDALKNGNFTDYETAEELINDIRRKGEERLARKS